MVIRASLVVMVALVLAGCETLDPGGRDEPACSVTQTKKIKIDYDDSKIKIRPKVLNVKKKKKFEIHLDPDNGFENNLVTIEGKTADAAWIAASGKASDSPFVICVPDTTVIDQDYRYSVTVDGLGSIDPRVKVVP